MDRVDTSHDGDLTDVERASLTVNRELEAAAREARRDGFAVPPLRGKLLRPLVAYALVPPAMRSRLDHRFWFGALAIQMVHEASLLHDDILDSATERRGEATVQSEQGVGTALVLGDHYLTSAYSVATRAGSVEFLTRFIHAVERTVSGEIRQATMAGAPIDTDTYHDIILGKSGELFGAAAYLGGEVLEMPGLDERVALGRRLGAFYQQIDDLLDYCTHATSGKVPMQDYRQRKWTWVLAEAGVTAFGLPEEEVLEAIFGRRDQAGSAAERAVATLVATRDELMAEGRGVGACPDLLSTILDAWVSSAASGVGAQAGFRAQRTAPRHVAPSNEALVYEAATNVGDAGAWRSYFGRHARTFSLAARLFPAEPARQVEGLYAYCRVTDDLVDDPIDHAPVEALRDRLELWRDMSRSAYEGTRSGIPVLDFVMPEAVRAGVEWRYPEALLDGVGMDLAQSRYEDWQELERYTFGVAGAVGGWMSQLFGIRDPEMLARAHSLGHAMQLTNIARDVGEDLVRNRVYLPRVLAESHGFSVNDLRLWQASRAAVPRNYQEAVEELMSVADEYYRHAGPGLAELPAFFRRPVSAAAEAYRGIHEEIRRNGYDNLNRRAHTKLGRKMLLGARGLLRARRRHRRQPDRHRVNANGGRDA